MKSNIAIRFAKKHMLEAMNDRDLEIECVGCHEVFPKDTAFQINKHWYCKECMETKKKAAKLNERKCAKYDVITHSAEELVEDVDDEIIVKDVEPETDIVEVDEVPVEEIPAEEISDESEVAEVEIGLKTEAEAVMASYQNANKWLDSVKEALYTNMSCPFFSSFVHNLAHTMPGRFDKFGDILHTIDMEIPYPTTVELEAKPETITDAFDIIFKVLDGIKTALNTFIEATDKSYHGMSCAAEGCLNDIENEYPMLFRLRDKWNQCENDSVEFDKYVMQYVENKDKLVEEVNKVKFKKFILDESFAVVKSCTDCEDTKLTEADDSEEAAADLILGDDSKVPVEEMSYNEIMSAILADF